METGASIGKIACSLPEKVFGFDDELPNICYTVRQRRALGR
jgi:hypothetical protein